MVTVEPAKIVLTGSHQKITADRGSVAVITADIVDSKGNHVYRATNTLTWIVGGPAILAGPSSFESNINKHSETDGVWYINTPVSNVLRSTGKPGKIKITVSAAGLASGSIEIEAGESIYDNPVVIEPLLDDKFRKPVEKITSTDNRTDDVPREIKIAQDDFDLTSGDKPGYERLIRNYILSNNTSLDTAFI